MFPKGMGGMMKKAQQMQKEMLKIQKEIEELEIEGKSGGGLISVLVNGKKKVVSINIDCFSISFVYNELRKFK